MIDLGVLIISFVVLIFGIGPALMPLDLGSPLRRVTVGIAASLTALYLLGFSYYLLNVPVFAYWSVFIAAVVVAWFRRRRLLELWSDRDVRHVTLAWAAIAAWVLGWQSTVYSYSGATWQGDCYEHFDRSRFFLRHWDIHFKFLGAYSVSSRPPLVNIVTGVLRALAGGKFYVYQAVCALLASLVVWPTCLLQQRFTRPGASARIGWAILLLMALPALVQNASFTWTKLPTAFFVLTGLALLLDWPANFPTRLAGWLTLTAGMLAHYSAGPWIVAVALAEFFRNSTGWRRLFSRQAVVVALACGLLFATWIGWSALRLGLHETLESNTTVADGAGMTWHQRLEHVADNLYYTAVPVLFRKVDYGGYLAADPAVRVRDSYFNAVQSSALMIAGSLGVVIASCLLWSERKSIDWRGAHYWVILIGVAVLLGIAVHTEVIELGVGQICLLPFALLVVAWLAARIPETRILRWVLIPGLIADFVLGICLHFSVQSLWLPRWRYPGKSDFDLIQMFGHGARCNLQARQSLGQPYLYDLPGAPLMTALLLGVAVVLLGIGFRVSASREQRPLS